MQLQVELDYLLLLLDCAFLELSWHHPSNLVTIGDFHSPAVILTLIGLILAAVLMTLRVSGALFISMIVTGIIAFFTGQLKFADKIVAMPHLPEGIIVSNPINAFSDVIEYGLYGVVFSFYLYFYSIQQVHYSV